MITLQRLGRAAVVGYLLGMIPSADLASRFAGGPDLRSVGSGNPGASNAASVLGPKAGLAVLAADIAKGALAGRLGAGIGAGAAAGGGAALAQVASSAAVIGHCYPAGSGRSGGKGVATSVGQVLSTFPPYFPIDVVVAVGTAATPRWRERAFAATSVSSAVWVLSSFVWWRRGWANAWGPQPTASLPVGAAVSSAVIFSRFWRARRTT